MTGYSPSAVAPFKLQGVQFKLDSYGKITARYRRHKIEEYSVSAALAAIASIDADIAARAEAKANLDAQPLAAAPPEADGHQAEEAAIPAYLASEPPARWGREAAATFEPVIVRRWHRGESKLLIYRADGKPDTVAQERLFRPLTEAEKAAYLSVANDERRYAGEAEALGVSSYAAARALHSWTEEAAVEVTEEGFLTTLRGRRIVADRWDQLLRTAEYWLIALAYPWAVDDEEKGPEQTADLIEARDYFNARVFKTREQAEAYVAAVEARKRAKDDRITRWRTLRLDVEAVPR
jgi:hypothetical protein